jgi:hypothetical protein
MVRQLHGAADGPRHHASARSGYSARGRRLSVLDVGPSGSRPSARLSR